MSYQQYHYKLFLLIIFQIIFFSSFIKITVKEVIYCEQCGWPVDLCKYHTKKEAENFQCEETLRKNNIELWKQIYNISDDQLQNYQDESNLIQQTEEIQENEDQVEDQKYAIPENQIPMFGRPIQQSQKKKSTYIPMLQIRKASRGNNKFLTQVFNNEDFPQISDTKQLCHILAKQFNGSCGTTTNPDGTGSFISLQGDNVEQEYHKIKYILQRMKNIEERKKQKYLKEQLI